MKSFFERIFQFVLVNFYWKFIAKIADKKEEIKMRTSTQQQNRSTTPSEDVGLGPKKTFLVLFTVVGCIAILFPKIFYPMIMGPSAKELRGPPSKTLNNFFKLKFIFMNVS